MFRTVKENVSVYGEPWQYGPDPDLEPRDMEANAKLEELQLEVTRLIKKVRRGVCRHPFLPTLARKCVCVRVHPRLERRTQAHALLTTFSRVHFTAMRTFCACTSLEVEFRVKQETPDTL
jgi:hypothetical protein